MFEALVSGVIAGLGVAVPLGAIGVMLVDLGMRGGFRAAAPAAAAVATADLLYAAVAAAAGSAAASLLEPHEHALKLTAAGVLAAVAAVGLRAAWRRAKARGGDADGAASGPERPRAGNLYARFLGLTAINPTTVLYFAALIAGLPAISDAPASSKAVFVVAVGAASLTWQLTLAGSGAALHHRLPDHARIYTALAGNALILGLAVRMALSA
jgi:threonine/homoserine/homoserine lactone efflux protein